MPSKLTPPKSPTELSKESAEQKTASASKTAAEEKKSSTSKAKEATEKSSVEKTNNAKVDTQPAKEILTERRTRRLSTDAKFGEILASQAAKSLSDKTVDKKSVDDKGKKSNESGRKVCIHFIELS